MRHPPTRRAVLQAAAAALAVCLPRRARAGGATLTIRERPLTLRHAWTLSRNSSTVKRNLFVTLRCDGIEGLGEAAPNVRFHETPESAAAALERARPIIGSLHPSNLVELRRRLARALPDAPSARCALDVALWDWNARALGAPIYRVLGLSPDAAPPTSFSLGIAAAPELQKKVAEAAAFPILKIKLGAHERDGISDREILRTVRAAAPDKRLRIDPNEGWTLERAREHFAFLKTLPGPPIELCEQPLPASDRAGLAALFRDRDRPPILLDESLIDARDLPGLVGLGDGVVVKLQKAGGISGALEQITVARSLGLTVFLGCMIESSVGITAAAHLAPLCDYVDLDGHLLIADDPYSGVQVEAGRLRLPGTSDGAQAQGRTRTSGRPGLGVLPAPALRAT